MRKKLSVVVSCYNEELALRQFYKETSQVLKSLPWDYELIFVNDGSQDGSLDILNQLADEDERVKVIAFSCGSSVIVPMVSFAWSFSFFWILIVISSF